MGARIRSLAGIALVMALAAVASSAPVALSQSGEDETFKMKSLDKKEKTAEVDVNGDGDAEDLGDRDSGGGPLYQNGKRAGTQWHDCVNTKVSNKAVILICDGSFTIKGRGTIEVSGWIKFSRPNNVTSRLAIVGGTRDFRNAIGHVVLGSTKNTTTFEFHVSHR